MKIKHKLPEDSFHVVGETGCSIIIGESSRGVSYSLSLKEKELVL